MAEETRADVESGLHRYLPLREQLIKREPWFFKPCFEYLSFLKALGFTYDGESYPFPGAHSRILFFDDDLWIEVLVWNERMRLPEFTIRSQHGEKHIIEPKSVAPDWTSKSLSYDEVIQLSSEQLYAEVSRQIAEFSIFLKEHLEDLRRVALSENSWGHRISRRLGNLFR